MSATATQSGGRLPPSGEPETERCAQCSSPLAEGQEWCLECGSSRTLIYPPPDWRIPVAVVVVVILLALGGFLFALSRLSSTSSPTPAGASASAPPVPAQAQTGVTSPSAPPAAGTTTRIAGIGTWPIGQSGWTVSIESFGSETQAYARAHHVLTAYRLKVGVLDSSDHPAMAPGAWILFYGRYTSRSGAAAAAARLVARGYTQAQPERVARRGGL